MAIAAKERKEHKEKRIGTGFLRRPNPAGPITLQEMLAKSGLASLLNFANHPLPVTFSLCDLCVLSRLFQICHLSSMNGSEGRIW
jgi:hypothetical protein